jgi:hypothetical protein
MLRGIIDLHIHTGPSVANRKLDVYEMMINADKAGYTAFVMKDHYFPSMMGTMILQKHFAKQSQPFGCICLNNSIGGINIHAVDAACNMGAKIVFMPTVSAKNHLDHYNGKKFAGAGSMSVPEVPIYYLDENNQLIPEVKEVLNYLVKEHPEVVLGTGHGSPEEIDKLIEYAIKIGLKKILVNHPFFHLGATIDNMKHWAEQGAFIELNAVVFNDVEPAPHHLSIEIAQEVLNIIGPKKIVVDSDLGQANNSYPTEGLLKFLLVLKEKCNVTDSDLDFMCIKNPSMLLGLS